MLVTKMVCWWRKKSVGDERYVSDENEYVGDENGMLVTNLILTKYVHVGDD